CASLRLPDKAVRSIFSANLKLSDLPKFPTDPFNACAARMSAFASPLSMLFRIWVSIRGDSAQKTETISPSSSRSLPTPAKASVGSNTDFTLVLSRHGLRKGPGRWSDLREHVANGSTSG